MKKVTIVDHGIGNVMSVRRAFEHVGAQVILTDAPDAIADADRLVLPGVGAFAEGMQGLRARGLEASIKRNVARGRPFLGICLGMQLLLDASEEFGEHEGLAIIPGKVVAIPPVGIDRKPRKIPHIGWSPLLPPSHGRAWTSGLLAGVSPGDSVYFVHSFTAAPANPLHRLADCHHDGAVIAAAIARDNVHGCQFHPEKSGRVGLKVVANFLAL